MIIIIDNYDSYTYNLYQLCTRFEDDIRVYRNDAITVDEVVKLGPEAVIISPGPKAPEDAGICVELIRKIAPSIPILGVCLGMQSIGAAFGASIVRAPVPMHGKTSLVYHDYGMLYTTLSQPFVVGRYHSLVIDSNTLPKELIKDAETEDGIVMGVRHRDYPCYGVQFHPESILTEEGERLVGNFFFKIKHSDTFR